jgi:6-phospho-beta-glucosidase
MAQLKIAYIGGGSTRAPGTVAAFIERHQEFAGSEIVLIDLDLERLEIVQRIARAMIAVRGADLTVRVTTDRREGLEGCDAVLTSFRPGGFEARVLDERIPLEHGVIGQETQGPGGFFMALRSIAVMQGIINDMEAVCPNARLFNYTNPVNIVSQAVTEHSSIETISLCEGPLVFPDELVGGVGLDPAKLETWMVGLNHASWTVRHRYDGADLMPKLEAVLEDERARPQLNRELRRWLELTVALGTLGASYMKYYYWRDEVLAELRAKSTTRAEDIVRDVPDYWAHYAQQAQSANPVLEPARSRGGLFELELAVDVMSAMYNDRRTVWPVNVVNRGALPGFEDDSVVEVSALCDRFGATPLSSSALPRSVRGLTGALEEYQRLAALAAWGGSRRDAIRALVANPLVLTLQKAETLFDAMAAAHRAHLPARLLEGA